MLLTDEDARELRRNAVAASTFGVGAVADSCERMLERLAHEGDGNFHHESHPAYIPTVRSAGWERRST
jgi:hypothetical protein